MPIQLSIRLGLGSNSGVSILGSAQVGDTLSLSGLPAVGVGPDLTYRPQWYRDGVAISGAVNATFYVDPINAGHEITATVQLPDGTTVSSTNSVVIPTGTLVASWDPPAAAVSAAYSSAPTITGGTGIYEFELTSGFALPPGFSLDAETGEVSATSPTTAGTYQVGLTITDSGGAVGVIVGTIVVLDVPAALTSGDWSVAAAQGQPHKAVFTYLTAIPANIASARYQAIAGSASTGWTGNYSVTGATPPVINTAYTCVRDVPTGLIGTSIKVRSAFVSDLGQTTINFAAGDIKTVALAPLVSAVTDTGGTLQATVDFTTTGASGTAYMAPMSAVDTGLSPEDQARAVKAASVALGSTWQKTISASGAQSHTITGLAAGTTFSPVHVVHEISGVISNWSAGDGFVTAGASAPALTVTNPTGTPETLSGGTFADFMADADTIVTAAYSAAGTATGAANGAAVTLSLIATLAHTPAMLAALPGSPTLTQFLDTIESGAVTWFNGWSAQDDRTVAEWVTDTPNTTLTNSYTVTVSGSAPVGQPKILMISGMDFGDAGIVVDGGWTVIVHNTRAAGFEAINASSLIMTDCMAVGRGDGSEHWSPGWSGDAVRRDASCDLLARGLIVTGQPRDALKGRRAPTGVTRKGKFHLSCFYVNAANQYPAAPAAYNAATSYVAGQVFYPAGVTQGPRYWRVLQPFTDYLATTGQTSFPVFSSSGSNAYLLYQDIHADGYQDICTNETVILEGGVFALGSTSHLLGSKASNTAPKANAALFPSWPDDRGVTGPSVFRGIRIKDPDGAYKGLQSVGTTVSGGVTRPPAQTAIYDVEMHDTTQTWDFGGDSIVTYARITNASAATITPSSPAVEDTTLPTTTATSILAAVATPVSMSAGTASVASAAWSASVNVPYSGALQWAINAVLGTLSATATHLLRTDVSGTVPTYTATVATLAYDKAIFDSGAALGLNSATIPVSGTTDAPNGTSIEVRAIHYFDATDVPTGGATAWATVGTASAAAWSGTIAVPRVPGTWSRAQVRVVGSTDIATGTSRFAAGHVWAMYEQSNWFHVINLTDTLAAAAVSDPEAVQLFRSTRNTNSTPSTASRNFITTANPVSPGMVAFANVLIAERPGEKFAIAAHLLSGSTPMEMIRDPGSVTYPLPTSDSGRHWQQETVLNDLVTACGQKVGVVFNMGWVAWNQVASNAAEMLPFMVGKEFAGTPVSIGATTAYGHVLTHSLTQLYTFWNGTTGYTRAAFCGPQGQGQGANKTSWITSTDLSFEGLMANWVTVAANSAAFPEMLPSPATNDGALRGEDNGAGSWTDYIHHHGHVDWGRNRLARIGALNCLKTAGLASWTWPAITNSFWEPTGAYADFWIAGRNLTTERNRTGGASSYVRGWSLNGTPLTTAQIQTNAGGSGYTGVRVTPPSGVFDYTVNLEYGRGELPGFTTFPTDYQTGYVLDLLAADVGAAGMPAVPVKMRSTSGLGNPLPAPAVFTITSPTGPMFKDTAGIGSNSGALTVRAKMKWTGGGASNLLTLSASNIIFERLNDGTFRLALKDSGAATILGTTTLTGTAPDNVVKDVILSVSLPSQSAKLWLDGVNTTSLSLGSAGSGSFGTARVLLPFGNGNLTPSGSPNAVVEYISIWKAYTSTGDTAALGTPYKRIEGGSGGSIVQTPSTSWIV